MQKTIAVIGALDTKGQEYAFLKEEIEKRGCRPLVVNGGVIGEPYFPPDVQSEEVAAAGGVPLAELVEQGDRGRAMEVMTRGAAVIARRLFDQGKIDGIISMGGGGGTIIGTSAMRALPVGFPKMMVSTVASGDTSAYVGTTDITMMPSIVDVAGLYRISRTIFTNAAGAICGMVTGEVAPTDEEKPLIAATMFGNTTRAVDNARQIMEANGLALVGCWGV